MPASILTSVCLRVKRAYFRWFEGRLTGFNPGKNAYGLLTFLATFTLAQGTAVATVVQLTDAKAATLVVYSILWLMTLAGLRTILSVPKEDPPNQCTHDYDRGTIYFGRWSVAVSTFFFVALTTSVSMGWLTLTGDRRPLEGGTLLLEAPVSLDSRIGSDVSLDGKRLVGADLRENESLLLGFQQVLLPKRRDQLSERLNSFMSAMNELATEAKGLDKEQLVERVRGMDASFTSIDRQAKSIASAQASGLSDIVRSTIGGFACKLQNLATDGGDMVKEDLVAAIEDLRSALDGVVGVLGQTMQTDTAYLVRSVNQFSDDYRTSRARLDLGSEVSVGGRLAFLYREDGGVDSYDFEPVWRPLKFFLDDAGDVTEEFSITNPNRGDRLVLFVYLSGVEPGTSEVSVTVFPQDVIGD